jgi:hypothetical protein
MLIMNEGKCKFCGSNGKIVRKTERPRGYVYKFFICENCGKGVKR